MRPLRRLLLALSTFSLLAPGAAHATDWYVDASAASGGTGSQTSPFRTINAVLAGLQRGDTVWIASGTYDETVNFWHLPGAGTTTIRALPNATPIIDGTSGSSSAGYVLQAGTPGMVFEDLTIRNSAGDGIEIYYADGCQVLRCTTTGITGAAVVFYYSNTGTVSSSKLQGGVSGRRSMGTTVQDSELYGASAHEGITLYDDSKNCEYLHNVIHDNYSVNLYLDSISHSVIDGNLVYESAPGNDLVGIELSDETYSDLPAPVNSYNTIVNNVIVGHQSGIQFWSGSFPASAGSGLKNDLIANNTLVNNVGGIKWDSGAHTATKVENNIVVANASISPSYLLQANSTSGVTLDHNLWYASSIGQPFLWSGSAMAHAAFVTASGQGGGDVLADPRFAGAWSAPPASNLEPMARSPAVSAGATLAAVPDDFLGAARPTGGPYDIGAFQYGAVVPDGGAMPPSPLGDSGAGDASAARATDAGPAGGSEGGPAGPASDAALSEGGGLGEGSDASGAALATPSSRSGCACSSSREPGPGAASLLAWVAVAGGLVRLRRRAAGGRSARDTWRRRSGPR